MNQVLKTMLVLSVRVLLMLAGLIFLLSLLAAGLLLALVWLVRALWARLTGQAVRPWTFQVNRQALWSRFYRPSGAEPAEGQAPAARSGRRTTSDVVDVPPEEIRWRDVE